MIFCLISGRLSNGNIAKMIACRYNVNCELSLYWWWWCISTSQWWQQASLSQVGRQGESHLVIGGERGTLGTLTYTARRWKWFGSWLVTLTQVTQDTQLSSHSQFITKLTSPDNCFPVALDSNLLEWHCHLLICLSNVLYGTHRHFILQNMNFSMQQPIKQDVHISY